MGSEMCIRDRVAPWTRDVAQDINHFDGLFDFIGRSVDVYTQKDKRMIQ